MYNFVNARLIRDMMAHGYSYPTPSNLNYFWGFGSLVGLFMVGQIVSGILLSMHYCCTVELANYSVEYILRDVRIGWFFKYFHSSVASLLFFFIYIHIGKGIYFRGYRKGFIWRTGLLVYFIIMGISFLGYTLPFGQMSLWGATVITNLIGVVFPPSYIDFVLYAWGGRSVGEPTLKRFYSLHFALPAVLLGLIFFHIYFLHVQGSTNPLGVTNHLDEVRFYPKYWVKDFFGFLLIGVSLLIFLVFYNPFFISDPDNYVEANPLSTPKHITPEWYFLPFYGMLRSIPDKVKGVCVMFLAIIVLFFLPIIPFKSKTSSFCAISQFLFWCFVCNFVFLGWLAAHPVVFPYTVLCAFSTGFYFFYLLILLPLLCYIEIISLNYRKASLRNVLHKKIK